MKAPSAEQGGVRELALTTPSDGEIEGTWQGVLEVQKWLVREILRISRTRAGGLTAELLAIDYESEPISMEGACPDGNKVKFTNSHRGFAFEGVISSDLRSITGALRHDRECFSLVLERVVPGIEWIVPTPPPKMPPMRRDARPGIETIAMKPTNPDFKRFSMAFRGREVVILGYTLSGVIKATFELHERQLVNVPGWACSDRFDIKLLPDEPGVPDGKQFSLIVRTLFADQFGLRFHEEQEDMATYALTLTDAPKMTKSASEASSENGRVSVGPLGLVRGTNATMRDFAAKMQETVLDLPVLDQTGLMGRWDFTLKWTPDESQFDGRFKQVDAGDPLEALPPLSVAIEEQLGLKLEVQRSNVKVMVIDRIERPAI